MNDVSLIGRLAREPELITTDSGTDIAKLRLAVDRRRRGDGAVFVDVKCFEAQARAYAEHLAKGRQVAVSGRLELDEWQADEGTKRSRPYVIAQSVQFPSGKPAAGQPATVAGHDGGEQAGLGQPPGPRPVRPPGQAADRGAPAMTSPDRLDPLSFAGSLAYLEADVPPRPTLPAWQSQRTTLGSERPQAGRAATGGDGEHHSRDRRPPGNPTPRPLRPPGPGATRSPWATRPTRRGASPRA